MVPTRSRFLLLALGLISLLLALPAAASAATFTVTHADDVNDAVCDATHCSLREAINAGNANNNEATTVDNIEFSIFPGGAQTITPATALPNMDEPTAVLGDTQPGFAGTPLIFIDGVSTTGSTGLLTNNLATNSLIRSVAVGRFQVGIHLNGAGSVLEGSYVGLAQDGVSARGNTSIGVRVTAMNGRVGGTTATQRNVIANSGIWGVQVDIGDNVAIGGNYIGTRASGTVGATNNIGVRILDTENTTVGVTPATGPNLISGNGTGIVVQPFAGQKPDNLLIRGNVIGLDAGGSTPLANGVGGVQIATGAPAPTNTTISENTISGNTSFGIQANAAVSVFSNRIGTDVAGTADRGNTTHGIDAVTGVATIGSTALNGNVISGNNGSGVRLASGATGSTVRHNRIGTDAAQTVALGNTADGIRVETPVSTIDQNTIANNGGDGVSVVDGTTTSNAITFNRIFANTGLGIDLGADNTVEAIDADPEAGEANEGVNFPTITGASSASGDHRVLGTYTGKANTSILVEIFSSATCDASGFGEGANLLDSQEIVTDGTGAATFDMTNATTLTPGQVVTATATQSAAGIRTSEFSQCFTVTSGVDLSVTQNAPDPPPFVGTAFNDVVTVTNGGPDTATSVVVTVDLPAGLEVISSPGCTSTGPQQLECAVPNPLAPAAQHQFTINAKATTPGLKAINAQAASPQLDNDPADNSNTLSRTFIVEPTADLAISQNAPSPPPFVGTPFDYTATVANSGPDAATGVSVLVTFPDGLTGTPPAGCSPSGPAQFTCAVGSVAAAGQQQLTFSATATSAGVKVVQAQVSASQPDPNGANNSSTLTRTFENAPVVVVTTPTPSPSPSPVETPTPTPTPVGPLKPVTGKKVNVKPIKGKVTITLPGGRRIELKDAQQIPTGSVIDTRKGIVELTTTGPGGVLQTARFWQGIFKITQTTGKTPVTQLELVEKLAACPKASKARNSVVDRKPTKRVLWGDGKGRFRTKGRKSAAIVTGTKWQVTDSCAGTLTRVSKGTVRVQDFRKRRTVTVKAGGRYLAR